MRHSRQLGDHRFPDSGVSAPFPGVDDAALRVDEDDVRLVVGA